MEASLKRFAQKFQISSLALVAALWLLALSGCGGSDAPSPKAASSYTPERSPTAAPAPEPTSTAVPSVEPTGAPAPVAAPTDVPATAVAGPAPTAQPSAAPGEVSITLGDGSLARYVIREQLARNDLPNDAVGETPDVSGSIVFDADGAVVSERSRLELNLATLRSDSNRRDDFLRGNSLESNKFPTAEFVVNDTTGMPWPLPDSGEASFQLSGDMRVCEVTRPLTWDVTVEFGPNNVTGQTTTTFTFDTFEIEKPSLFFIISVADEIRLELDIAATVASGG